METWEKIAEGFWAVMVFASIAWYFFLLFYVGIRGGREILRMGHRQGEKPDAPATH
jgi:hypothetical protein